MYKNIVVGTDFSDTANQAVEQAVDLARAGGGILHVVTAFKPVMTGNVAASSLEAMAFGGVTSLQDAHTKIADEVESSLGRIAERLSADGLTVKTYGSAGDPADALLDVAEATKADVIVVGNRGMGGTKRFILGSVPNKISHHAPCSVLIVHTT
jgi:nucleotide-binding universal stress UspA family protein